MLAGGPALVRKGCFSSSAAVARWAGSRTSRRSRKPFRDGEAWRSRGQGQGYLLQGHFPVMPCGLKEPQELPQGHKGHDPEGRRLISSPLPWSGQAGSGPFPRANPQQDGPIVRLPGPELCGSLGLRGPHGSVSGVGGGTRRHLRHSLALFTLCRFFSRGGRLSRIIFMALRGGSLK